MPDQQTPPSPLAEADPKSLDELFNADPLELKEEAESQTKARPRRPSKYKAVPPKGSLSLENLGLTNVTLPKSEKE
jgi:hypothetical protein